MDYGRTFNTQTLAKRLTKLNNSQHSVETLSQWCMGYMNNAKEVVKTWENEFRFCLPDKKISFLYLANDIMQKTREKSAKFIGEFRKVLPYALSDIIFSGNDDAKKVVNRLISIWEERQLFYPDVKDLRAEFFGGNRPRNFVIYKPKQPTPDRLECDNNLGDENNPVDAAELQGQECLQRNHKRKFKAVLSQISKMELELSKLRSLVQKLANTEDTEEIPPPPPASTYPEPPPPPDYPPESPKAAPTEFASDSHSHDAHKRARLDNSIQSQQHLAPPLPPPSTIQSASMPLPQFTCTPSVTNGFSMFTAPPYSGPTNPPTFQPPPYSGLTNPTLQAPTYPGTIHPSTHQAPPLFTLQAPPPPWVTNTNTFQTSSCPGPNPPTFQAPPYNAFNPHASSYSGPTYQFPFHAPGKK